jgi:PAS domain S-box-containing protein
MGEKSPDGAPSLELLIIAARLDDASRIVRAAEQGGVRPSWQRVDCESAFIARLAGNDLPQMIIAEIRPSRFGALQALALVKGRSLDIPIIVVSEELSAESIECLKQGIADYLTADCLEQLPAAIRQALEQKRLRNDLRRAESQLRESEERYRNLVENAPDAILVISDGRVVYANDAGTRLLGAEHREDLLGRDFLDFVHPDYHALVRQRSKQVLENKPTGLAEMQLMRLDGEVTDVEAIGMPCLFDGRPAVQRMLRDVSNRRRAQERAREHLAELAHVTRLRMMGELMSEVSHEINQPLYAISNFAEASLNRLRSGSADLQNEILVWLEQIAVQANRAGEIIRRIGRFVRKSPARMADTSINDIVRDVVDLLGVDGRLDAVDLDLQLSPNLPPVKVDRIQIEQVLVNLLQNALEAMADNPSASRRLCVRTESGPSGTIRVAVRDNGRGLTDDELKRLFEPFFTTKSEGMGMGLSISHSIIEAHGGRMEAAQNSDRGLTFQFTLPASQQETSHGK